VRRSEREAKEAVVLNASNSIVVPPANKL
jgi:hypothetical protein